MNLNYINLDGGMQYEAMRALTGQPVVIYQTKKQSQKDIWENIADADGENFIMTASCLKDYAGLIGGHAYTILGVQELTDRKGIVSEQLIKLRNAIGLEEYTGPWNNDDDGRWTKAYRK